MAVPREACLEAAAALGCDVATIQAVADVESGGRTDPTVFLFEPHWFSRLTNGHYDYLHPTLSYPRWDRAKYPRTRAARDAQFAAACKLDGDKAHQAASWGLFQIMGFNHAACGYSSAEAMADALKTSVAENVRAFCHFIKASGWAEYLAARDWAGFARRYNGPGYAQNAYDRKLRAAWERYRSA